MSWRVTYAETGIASFSSFVSPSQTLLSDSLLSSEGRTELREDAGTIVRLGKGATMTIKESPLGLRPEYGDGPVLISRKGQCGKYRTSCWFAPANPPSDHPDIFIRPGNQSNTDEFFAVSGDIVIYEFDESNRTFTICTIHEGEKATISYDENATSIRSRYITSINPIPDQEYELILTEFIDRRNWI